MLTRAEHEASLRVLRALRKPVCASVLLTWGPDDTRAYVRLARMGYVGTESFEYDKPTQPFRWNRMCVTPEGAEYLRQIEVTQGGVNSRHTEP